MIIAVNTHHLLKGRLEGFGSFADEILSRLVRNHPEHKFLFIFDRDWDESFIYADNIIPVKTFLPSRHPVLWYTRCEFGIPNILSQHKVDLFLSPDGFMPTKCKVKTYNVIHDIGFVHNPKGLPKIASKYYNHFFPIFAHNANRLGTVSEYSKNDIVKTWGVDPDKIDVIYNGVKTIFKPLSLAEQQQVKAEKAQGTPYFLYVGSINPRKNIEGLLKAFDAFKEQTSFPHKLLIVGECMWSMSTVDTVLEHMAHADDVIFLGRVDMTELHRIVASAYALLLVSFLEGFGIPLVEALSCNVPVITSNCTSMPEVAGDAGLLVDPYSVDSITDAMTQMVIDTDLRSRLIAAAPKQSSKFTWDKSAIDLWNGIERLF